MHCALLGAGLAVPGGHGVHCDVGFGAKLPAGHGDAVCSCGESGEPAMQTVPGWQ